MRVTRPRIAVLTMVADNPHSDADTIVSTVRRDLGSVSIQGVYDVLHALTDAGLLRRIEPAGSAAAIIMTSVFAGFVFSHLTMVRPIGFGLAFGVLLDAFVVRMVIVPAAMHLLGKSAWWLPRWLDRLLPDVDVEGSKLAEEAPAGQASELAVQHH